MDENIYSVAEMNEVVTYPEMNEAIIKILFWNGSPHELYAAKRILELEERVKELETKLENS